MVTTLYILSFLVGALATSYLLYFLRTRKIIKEQNQLINLLIIQSFGEDIERHIKERRERQKAEQEIKDDPETPEAAAE